MTLACPSGLPTYVPPIPITLKMISNMQDHNEQMKNIIKKKTMNLFANVMISKEFNSHGLKCRGVTMVNYSSCKMFCLFNSSRKGFFVSTKA